MEAIGIVALVAVVLTAVGVVFAVRGFQGLRSTRRFVASSASATGTVTDSVGRWYRTIGDEPGFSRLSHPVVRFITGDGRTVEFESQAGSNLAPKVGQQVTVLYDPLKPEEAKLKSFMMLWALPSILTALGVFLLFPRLLMLFVLVLILAL
jgi:Protein of unknown function (DUF3592)